MIFWTLIAFMAISIAALLALVLIRTRDFGEPPAAYDLRVYQQQLKDVDKDLARGVINQGDADRIRTEVSRRILAADAQLQNQASGSSQPKALTIATAVSLSVALVAGGGWLYHTLGAPGYGDMGLETRIALAQERADSRPSQADAEAKIPAEAPLEVDENYLKLLEQLRATTAQRPDDAEGHALLARHEANVGNFKAAYQAKKTYLDIMSGDVEADDFSELAELMVIAAAGYVSPEAEEALKQALALDPHNGPARYYWGQLLIQTGRPDLAYKIWSQTLAAGPAGAPWIIGIQAQIEELAFQAGIDYRPIEPAPGGMMPPPGPSAEDVENAAAMDADERQEMIRGMVARLSDRLATEGGTAQEWARLISALGVLGDTERAQAVFNESKSRFAQNQDGLDLLRQAAAEAGLGE